MIDSVLLKLPYIGGINYAVFNYERTQSTHTHWRTKTMYAMNNKEFKQDGIYVPHLWLEWQRYPAMQVTLCIQVSLPKLLHGCNFYEISTENEVLQTLSQLSLVLKAVFNIHVTLPQLRNARVCRIDFATQFILPFFFGSAQDCIDFFYTVGYRPRTEIMRRDIAYGKQGFWLKFYNTAQSLTFYDKALELKMNSATREDHKVLASLAKDRLERQVLRMEVSLFKRDMVQRICKKYRVEPTLLAITKSLLPARYLLDIFQTSFLTHYDTLYLQDLDTVRTHIRNTCGYSGATFLYFLYAEIQQRGQKAVWDEIKNLYGASKKQRIRQQFTLFMQGMEKKLNQSQGPLAWMLEQLKLKFH